MDVCDIQIIHSSRNIRRIRSIFFWLFCSFGLWVLFETSHRRPMLFWVKGRVVAEIFGYVKHSLWDVENMVINLKKQELGLVESGYVTKWGGSTPVTRRWYQFVGLAPPSRLPLLGAGVSQDRPKKGAQIFVPNPGEVGIKRLPGSTWNWPCCCHLAFLSNTPQGIFNNVGHLASYFKNFHGFWYKFDQKCGMFIPKIPLPCILFCHSFFLNPCWLVNVTPIQWRGSCTLETQPPPRILYSAQMNVFFGSPEPKHVILVVPDILGQGHIHV